MKATYVKPRLNVEFFALSQSIAACAGVTPGGNSLGQAMHWSKATCAFKIGDDMIFLDNQSFCSGDDLPPADLADEVEVGGYCYNTPSGDMKAFCS